MSDKPTLRERLEKASCVWTGIPRGDGYRWHEDIKAELLALLDRAAGRHRHVFIEGVPGCGDPDNCPSTLKLRAEAAEAALMDAEHELALWEQAERTDLEGAVSALKALAVEPTLPEGPPWVDGEHRCKWRIEANHPMDAVATTEARAWALHAFGAMETRGWHGLGEGFVADLALMVAPLFAERDRLDQAYRNLEAEFVAKANEAVDLRARLEQRERLNASGAWPATVQHCHGCCCQPSSDLEYYKDQADYEAKRDASNASLRARLEAAEQERDVVIEQYGRHGCACDWDAASDEPRDTPADKSCEYHEGLERDLAAAREEIEQPCYCCRDDHGRSCGKGDCRCG